MNYPKETGSIDPETTRRIRLNKLHESHGTASAQSQNLIESVLAAFRNPAKWPMTDVERIQLLRDLYASAQVAKETASLEYDTPAALREHVVELSAEDTKRLRVWLVSPNGACSLGIKGRVNFEAVGHGGIFVRTLPYPAKP